MLYYGVDAMDNRAAVFRLFISSFICVCMLLYSGYDALANSQMIFCFASIEGSEQEVLELDINEPIDTQSESQPPQDTPDEAASGEPMPEQVIETAAKGNVLGSVVPKFLTPYTANCSYNGVYLKNSTDLNINIKDLLQEPLPFKIEGTEAQVLIMHTHTTESFLGTSRDYYTDKDLSRTLDENMNNVRLGEIIAKNLNSAGITTIHDKTVHDHPEYNGSYDRSAKTIKENLKKYPNIKVVIDLHRDAISAGGKDKVKPVVEIGGKKAAQVMLVMGSQSGSIKNHPNWRENLKLAVRLQQNLETMYPSLARALSLMPRLYNQNLCRGSMLLEIGTEVNSIDEVMYSAELVSHALIKTLKD